MVFSALEENSEPPPPPDIGGSSLPLNTPTVYDDYNPSLEEGDLKHCHAPIPPPADEARTRIEGHTLVSPTSIRKSSTVLSAISHPLFIACMLAALLPLATAATLPEGSHDPYTSYDAPASSPGSKHRTPILSLLKWALDGASSMLSRFIDSASSPDPSTAAFSGTASGATGASGGLKWIGKRELSNGEIVEACMIPVLVALSGMFAGLTLGYFSVDPTQLQVLSISGSPKQQKYARQILPIRKDSHLLLTTLILGNMIVNEALPVVMDNVIEGGIYAVIASTALVVIFAEIIPQSVCSRYGLLIGASMAWPVRVMTWIAFPIAWPVAKLLEFILGAHHGIIYRRSELRELIKMHAAGAEGGGDLDFDTVQMAQGALDLAQKSVKEAMTPIDQVFMLPIDAKLDYETLGHVVRSGHSRIPVYQMVEVPDIDLSAPTKGFSKTKMVKKVLGSLLVKSCVLLDPEDATPLASIPINAIPSVPWDERLTNMLNVFQEGRSHMAIVSRRPKRVENDPEDAQSVMTAAAGGMRQRFMRKVAEISHGNRSSDSEGSASDSDTDVERGEKAEKKRNRKKHKRTASGSEVTAISPTSTRVAGSATAAENVKEDAQRTDEKKKGLVGKARLTQLEQTVPADAQMPADAVEKFFEGLEGAPLGIITLEDVLEELIGEEIYDEYDEHGVPRSDASAFVPREAMLAASTAAKARQQLALAQSTPLPNGNDSDLATVPHPAGLGLGANAPGKRVIPKLPLAKFGLGKRPASQPGRARTEDLKPTGTGISTPSVRASQEVRRNSIGDQTLGTSALPAAGAMMGDDDVPPSRTQSDITPNARGPPTAHDSGRFVNADATSTTNITPTMFPLKGLDPVTAVPARLLSSGTPVTSNVAPPSAATTMLNEALLVGKRQRSVPPSGTASGQVLASGAGAHAAGIVGGGLPSMSRTASASAPASASGVARSAPPSRQPTPPIPSNASAGAQSSNQSQSTQASAITGGLAHAQGKKVPKFKSIPTPFVATPGTIERGDPLERREE